MLGLPNDDAVTRTPTRDNVRPGLWAGCQCKSVQSRQQTASAGMRLADKGAEGTEWIRSQGMKNPPLLSSIAPSLRLPLLLRRDKKSCSPCVNESQLFSLSSAYSIVDVCVSKCEFSLYSHQVEKSETDTQKKKNKIRLILSKENITAMTSFPPIKLEHLRFTERAFDCSVYWMNSNWF